MILDLALQAVGFVGLSWHKRSLFPRQKRQVKRTPGCCTHTHTHTPNIQQWEQGCHSAKKTVIIPRLPSFSKLALRLCLKREVIKYQLNPSQLSWLLLQRSMKKFRANGGLKNNEGCSERQLGNAGQELNCRPVSLQERTRVSNSWEHICWSQKNYQRSQKLVLQRVKNLTRLVWRAIFAPGHCAKQ